ncbi:MAG: spherulation-specific family 4 protein [Nitrososphaera sp.]|uniref:spherulation-specific family 4 protein n=1 Tax=Nitrososphaera sp. TaxID=1971748 RepID=UPI003D6DD823
MNFYCNLGSPPKGALALFLAAALLITITVSSFEIANAASSNTLLVPLYSWPVKYINGQRMLSDSWQTLYNTASANPNLRIMMILNPDNGNFGLGSGLLTQEQMASAQANPDILWAAQKMQSAGVVITGYVYTDYAARDSEICKQRIDLYKRLYGTIGIHFDQMSNVAGNESYYSNLDAYVKSTGMTFTMGNPGTSSPESYVGTVNTIIVYENKGLPTISTLQARTFNGKYDKNNFGAIPHTVARYDATWVAQAREVTGYIYVTNDRMPNPWDTLSRYTNQLSRDLQ